MKSKTLLEKAKKAAGKKIASISISDDHIELAVAWAKDVISIGQVASATGLRRGNCYPMLARALKEHIARQPNNRQKAK